MTPAPLRAAHPSVLPDLPAWPYPVWIAHRGAGKLAPENTLAAFRLGAAHGYRAFECDVKLSADGIPFLLHDATLDRTVRGSEHPRGTRASDLPWSTLARLDAGGWLARAWAGEPPASLEAVAAFCLRNGHALNLEIKPTPGDEARTGAITAQWAERLWAAAVHAGRSPWPLLSSFRPEALAAAQDTAPQLPRALLLDTLWPDCFTVASTLGCVAVVLNYTLVDDTLIRAQHAAGRRVLVYTVNDPAPADALLREGIDGIITDAVERFSPSEGPGLHD